MSSKKAEKRLLEIIEQEAYDDMAMIHPWVVVEATIMDHHPKQRALKLLALLSFIGRREHGGREGG